MGGDSQSMRVQLACFRKNMFAGGITTRAAIRTLGRKAAFCAGVAMHTLECHLGGIMSSDSDLAQDYLSSLNLDMFLHWAWCTTHTRIDGLKKYQASMPCVDQRLALDSLIERMQAGLTPALLLDWSAKAVNLMQAEINAYKVALGSYCNGFLGVRAHIKRLVGWELSRSWGAESAC
jgi:hypothetical protein